MYKDLISYELAEGTSQEDLLKIAGQIVEDWMKKQPGFIQWEITTDAEGAYTDIVSWASKEAAKKAELEMVNIPNAAAWYGCYKEGSISSRNLITVGKF